MAVKESVLVYECISGGGMDDVAAAHPDLLAQGVAMRDALVTDLAAAGKYRVSCAAGEGAPLPAPGGEVSPLPGSGLAPADFLARHAPHHDRAWVVAPETGGLLASLAEQVGARRWVGCAPTAIRLAASKSATRGVLGALGIPVPAAWRPGEPEPEPGQRWVVKPDDGVGATDTRLHAGFPDARADLEGRLSDGEAATLETWVDGIPMSLSLLCASGNARLLAINHQRIRIAGGTEILYEGVDGGAEPLDTSRGRELAALARDIAAAVPGLAGYVGVDLIWNPTRGPVVLEINPRLTCAYGGLSAAIGENVAEAVLRMLSEEAAADVPF